MPLDNSRVIPEGWAAHHRPVVDGTLGATVTLHHPAAAGTPVPVDPVTGRRTTPAGPAYFTGRARVQLQPSFAKIQIAGGQEITTYGYLVVVELDGTTEAAVGDLAKVLAVDDNGDPSLVGRALKVEGVIRGSLVWERDLICADDLG